MLTRCKNTEPDPSRRRCHWV